MKNNQKPKVDIYRWESRDEEIKKLRQLLAAKSNACSKQKIKIQFLESRLKRYQKNIKLLEKKHAIA